MSLLYFTTALFCHLPLLDQHQSTPAIDGVFGKDWCMDLWREEKQPHQSRESMETAAMTNLEVQITPPTKFTFCA